ncbi:MAG: hypothetical protein Q9169_002761 [Polycauliona sp. 2 TL-2023]
MSVSADGRLVAAMGSLMRISEDDVHEIPLEGQISSSTPQHLSPNGQSVLLIDEANTSRVLRGYRARDDTSVNVLRFKSYEALKQYVMDLNVLFHDVAPMFVMTCSAMDSYTGGLVGATYTAVILEDRLLLHVMSGTFHPNCGFSRCGKYFFGTVSMDEPDDSLRYRSVDDGSDLCSNLSGDEVDAAEPDYDQDFDAPGSEEPDLDEPAVEGLSIAGTTTASIPECSSTEGVGGFQGDPRITSQYQTILALKQATMSDRPNHLFRRCHLSLTRTGYRILFHWTNTDGLAYTASHRTCNIRQPRIKNEPSA